MDRNTISKLKEEEREGGYRGDSASKKLSEIADRHHYGGERIRESGVERDEVIEMLAGRGSKSSSEYMYGD